MVQALKTVAVASEGVNRDERFSGTLGDKWATGSVVPFLVFHSRNR